jgi:archaellin
MRYLQLIAFLILSVQFCQGQSPVDLEEMENKLAKAYNQLANSKDDAERDSASQSMRSIFQASLNDPRTFDFPFVKLKFSKITSADQKVRIYNWNQPKQDGTYKYYCFVQVKQKKKRKQEVADVVWYELMDNPKEPEKIESKFLNADKWLGALYYEITPLENNKKNDTYILLGWDGKDEMTTRKVLDAITITDNKVRLGAPVFKNEFSTDKRVIFEYSNEVSMSLKLYPKKRCIVFDHLSPKSAATKGIFADYGPDGTYDMYQFKNGKLEYLSNVDVSQFAADDDRPYNDPRKRKN